MGKFEEYLTDAFKYAFSDIKKGIIGGLLVTIPAVLMFLLGFIMAIYVAKYISSNMMYSMMLSFTLPKTVLMTIIVGIFALLISLIVKFMVDGYYVKIMKTTVDSVNSLPDWDNFVELIKIGFLYWIGGIVLGLMFFAIPIVMILIGMAILAKNPIAGAVLIGIGVILALILLIVYVFYKYLADVNYSVKGFMGFFEFKKIFKMMSLTYVILLIVVILIAVVVEGIVQFPFFILKVISNFAQGSMMNNNLTPIFIIDLVSVVVSEFVGFFMGMVVRRAIALYYKDKIEEENQKSES
jgi:hypothetical protein